MRGKQVLPSVKLFLFDLMSQARIMLKHLFFVILFLNVLDLYVLYVVLICVL